MKYIRFIFIVVCYVCAVKGMFSQGIMNSGGQVILTNTGTIRTTKTINAVTSYNPANLGLLITTSNNLGSITRVRGHQVQQGLGTFTANYGIARYFDIPGIGEINGTTINVEMYYWDAELNGHVEANLIEYQSVTQSTNTWWTPLNTSINTLTNQSTPLSPPYDSYITGAAYTSMIFNNRFTLGSTGIPLPVELIDLFAECSGNYITLNWTTASEQNNVFFVIEKSSDGIDFSKIGLIQGSGNSNTILTYSYIDDKPNETTNYYRLKQIDNDGKYNYSDIVATNCHDNGQNPEDIIIYNSPYNNDIVVTFRNNNAKSYRVLFTDQLGRLLVSKTHNAVSGDNTLQIDKSGLSSGVYNLTMYSDTDIVTKQVVIYK